MNTLLILDERSVSESRGVVFQLNRAAKHPENPVMLPGEPHQWDSLCVSWPGTVLYSERDKKFRCWYAGMDIVQTPDRAWHTGYAESDDGVHWRKPDLGHIEFLGKPTNRIGTSWNASFLSTVFENPLPDAPPSQRFGGYWTEHRFEGKPGDWSKSLWAKSLAWSPDGVTWTRASTAYGEKTRAPFLDISQLVYDPDDADASLRWKAYGQLFRPRPDGSRPPGIRTIALAHGRDPSLVVDAVNPIVLAPQDGVDEEVHFAAVWMAGAQFVMLFESDRFSRNPIHGDLRLAVSDDGLHFRRVHPNKAIVTTGPKGTWDENLLVTTTAGIQRVGDEDFIFYFGCPSTYNSWPAQYAVSGERRGSMFAPVFLGLAKLPRDRYAYAEGAESGGAVTTRPLRFTKGNLWLNAEGPEPKVTMRGVGPESPVIARGAVTRGWTPGVYQQVVWLDATGEAGTTNRDAFMRSLAGEHCIEVALSQRAKLYGLRYE